MAVPRTAIAAKRRRVEVLLSVLTHAGSSADVDVWL
jgi:hypothetical protein